MMQRYLLHEFSQGRVSVVKGQTIFAFNVHVWEFVKKTTHF
jgi:hypothetical protein